MKSSAYECRVTPLVLLTYLPFLPQFSLALQVTISWLWRMKRSVRLLTIKNRWKSFARARNPCRPLRERLFFLVWGYSNCIMIAKNHTIWRESYIHQLWVMKRERWWRDEDRCGIIATSKPILKTFLTIFLAINVGHKSSKSVSDEWSYKLLGPPPYEL